MEPHVSRKALRLHLPFWKVSPPWCMSVMSAWWLMPLGAQCSYWLVVVVVHSLDSAGSVHVGIRVGRASLIFTWRVPLLMPGQCRWAFRFSEMGRQVTRRSWGTGVGPGCPGGDPFGVCFDGRGVAGAASHCRVNAVEPLSLW